MEEPRGVGKVAPGAGMRSSSSSRRSRRIEERERTPQVDPAHHRMVDRPPSNRPRTGHQRGVRSGISLVGLGPHVAPLPRRPTPTAAANWCAADRPDMEEATRHEFRLLRGARAVRCRLGGLRRQLGMPPVNGDIK